MYTFIEAERGGGAAPHEEDPGQAAAAMCKNHGFRWGFNEGREVLHSEPGPATHFLYHFVEPRTVGSLLQHQASKQISLGQ